MASVIICDKCGVYSTDVAQFMNIKAHRFYDTEYVSKDAENHMDLCMECYLKTFKEVVENGN